MRILVKFACSLLYLAYNQSKRFLVLSSSQLKAGRGVQTTIDIYVKLDRKTQRRTQDRLEY